MKLSVLVLKYSGVKNLSTASSYARETHEQSDDLKLPAIYSFLVSNDNQALLDLLILCQFFLCPAVKNYIYCLSITEPFKIICSIQTHDTRIGLHA